VQVMMRTSWIALIAGGLFVGLTFQPYPKLKAQHRSVQQGVKVYGPSQTETQNRPAPARRLSPLDQLRVGNFTLQALDGSAVKLNDLLIEGKPVLIQFWQTNCDQSQAEVAYLKDVWSRYQRQGLVMLTLAAQDPAQRAQVNAFVRNAGINYPVYFTPPSLYRLMTGGALGTPQTYIFSRDGRIANRLIGWEPRRGQPALENALKSVFE
jgi:peroxiredoxin